nr:latrophilin receptor-like protein A [Lytechinus pictus]
MPNCSIPCSISDILRRFILKITAAITHYFLLAVFTWTNVLAWDLVRHFASSSFLPKRHIETRRMTVYHTIGWCLPLTIIVPCLIVQSQNPSLFRYGKIGSGCWIYQAKGIVLAFLVPVAVSFLINLVFFLLTACGVHKSKRDSRVLHEGTGKRHKEMFTELAVHFKISCLLGFGWTFGFIASFANSATVWTIFILTSSLQGIFVFIFFGANQRVRDLWRKKVCGSAAQTRTSTMALTSSTRVGSKTNSNIKTTSLGSTTRV